MRKIRWILQLNVLLLLSSSFQNKKEETYPLTVKVKDLRNENGIVQFALYNTHGSIPDEDYTKYYRKSAAKIKNRSAEITFSNLPRGKYAVNVLHDEDKDGKVKKGLILPKEGIGFSNFTSLKISNRPSFSKAAFDFTGEKEIEVQIIYL
jgi:uncharacterized protein (DUF2141 family)